LERFPKLPKAIFYDVACKIDKNAMKRVRVIMQDQGVRCILDRPHSITHSCSPVYMLDESLGTTAGVATQAAEVSHSVPVVNRTSLAYMAPATYRSHRMVQVAFMNLRKIYRLHADNSAGENDHIPLAPFLHDKISHQCERISVCSCDQLLSSTRAKTAQVGQQDAPSWICNGGAAVDRSAISTPPLDGPHGDQEDCDDVVGGVGDGGAPNARKDGQAGLKDQLDAAQVAAQRAAVNTAHEKLQAEIDVLEQNVSSAGLKPLISVPVIRAEARLVHDMSSARDYTAVVRMRNKARITLRVADMELLNGTAWLNDEVMNSFSALINYRSSLQADAAAAGTDGEYACGLRVCMLSTFFYSKLSARVGCYDYDGVREWGKKRPLNLEEVDHILVPVNLNSSHWILVTVDLRSRTSHYFDSLGSSDRCGVVANIRRWLGDEVRSRLGDAAAGTWKVDTWGTVAVAGLPEQHDGGSSGVFVLGAADCLSLGAALSFSQEHIVPLRQRIALALFFDSSTSIGFSSRLTVPAEEPTIDAVE